MSRAAHPWWASEGGTRGLEDVDPVEAFRAARRPAESASREAEGGDAAQQRTRSEPAEEDSGSRAHRPELCGICPLCTLARSLEDTRPELLEHLTEAARHLAAAARALMEPPPAPPPGPDGRTGQPGQPGQQGEPAAAEGATPGVERIPLGEQPGVRQPPGPPDASRDAGGNG